ncbi:MAG: YkgJ family cysteine cluster protein [Planctomycetaceae bacterium]
MKSLPVIDDCSDCGACCRMTPIPPFQPGEEVAKEVPDALMQPVRDRIAADQQFDMLACVWFESTRDQCRHYDLRPDACRKFEVGSDLCRMARWDVGVDP